MNDYQDPDHDQDKQHQRRQARPRNDGAQGSGVNAYSFNANKIDQQDTFILSYHIADRCVGVVAVAVAGLLGPEGQDGAPGPPGRSGPRRSRPDKQTWGGPLGRHRTCCTGL